MTNIKRHVTSGINGIKKNFIKHSWMMKQWTTLLVFLFLSLSLSAQQEYGRDIFCLF